VDSRRSLGRSVFFFSSRRRHTRLVSDWSSDVCSSDLLRSVKHRHRLRLKCAVPEHDARVPSLATLWPAFNWQERETFDMYGIKRSEERRVGKEGRSRGGADRVKKKSKNKRKWTRCKA